MQRLCGLMSGTMLMTLLWTGCGSTSGDDQLVLQFLRFDNTGITQADAVGQTTANVDVIQELCGTAPPFTPEPFTVTSINAVFRNNEASDINLNGILIDVGAASGRAPIFHNLGGVIPGGRCTNIDQQCATDADCQGVTGTCTHSETTISGILLFDFDDKAHIIPGTYSVRITFSGSDPNRSFETSTSYVVRFDDFDNCKSAGGGAAAS